MGKCLKKVKAYLHQMLLTDPDAPPEWVAEKESSIDNAKTIRNALRAYGPNGSSDETISEAMASAFGLYDSQNDNAEAVIK